MIAHNQKKIKVLMLTNVAWNDVTSPNNVFTNWFDSSNIEIAHVYASSELPSNYVCSRYFRFTDYMALKSIIGKKTKGEIVSTTECKSDLDLEASIPGKIKKTFRSALKFGQELIWMLCRIDRTGLEAFIKDFQPDLIVRNQNADCKLLRLEKEVRKCTDVPVIAMCGDDEMSLRQFSFSPSFWINRLILRSQLSKRMNSYKAYYCFSEEQAREYSMLYGISAKWIRKGSFFPDKFVCREVNSPVKMIYAGRLYCNRWKSLGDFANAIEKINKSGKKIELDVYTVDVLTVGQKKLLCGRDGLNLKGKVSPDILSKLYSNYDIALHIESMDIKNRLITRYSASTKIIDCLKSGCAVLAYCWAEHSGYLYLKNHDAAFCASSKDELESVLNQIVCEPKKIQEFAYKAYDCGVKNHNLENLRNELYEDFCLLSEGKEIRGLI